MIASLASYRSGGVDFMTVVDNRMGVNRYRRELLALDAAPELGIAGAMWSRETVYCKPLLERPIVAAALRPGSDQPW